MKAFSVNELENAFELGRIAQCLFEADMIEADSKELFNFALPLVTEFEEYYTDIEEFATEKFMETFEMED